MKNWIQEEIKIVDEDPNLKKISMKIVMTRQAKHWPTSTPEQIMEIGPDTEHQPANTTSNWKLETHLPKNRLGLSCAKLRSSLD
jgi:hypothetical protein